MVVVIGQAEPQTRSSRVASCVCHRVHVEQNIGTADSPSYGSPSAGFRRILPDFVRQAVLSCVHRKRARLS